MSKLPLDLDELLTWAESWLPTLAPLDLAGRPVYILDHRLPERLEACTGPAADLAYRAEIGGRWRGRGVAILIDLSHFTLDSERLRLVSHADDETITAMQGYAARRLMRVLLHEMGHVVLRPEAATPTTQRQARAVVDGWIWPPADAGKSPEPALFLTTAATSPEL